MNDVEFERATRRAVAWVRAESERVADPDSAFAQLMAGESGGLRSDTPGVDPSQRRRRLWAGLTSAAAVVALIVGIVVIGGEQSEAPILVSPTTSADPAPVTTELPTTTVEEAPNTTLPTTLTPSTTVAVTDPEVASPVVGPGGIALDELSGLVGGGYEYSGIDRSCVRDGPCTQVVFDPTGSPISFDPATGVVTRHGRNGASFTLPSVDTPTYLVTGGPDEVIYVLQSSDREESNDLVVYSLAAGDAGREIDRFATSYGIGDGELIPSPRGLVSAGSGLPGVQPAEIDDVDVPWVDRNGNSISSPVPVVRVDFTGITVAIGDRFWTFADPVDGAYPLRGAFTPTFDGGFVGVLRHGADGRTAVVRGWSDGSVDTWALPPETGVWTNLVPNPTGHVLIPTEEMFVTAELFPVRDPDFWTGERNLDVDAGTIDHPGLDEYLDAVDPGWESNPIGFAHAIAGPLSTPAERRTIDVLSADASAVVVRVTTENYFDDSVFGTRLVVRLRTTPDGYRADEVAWSQTCQPTRGHQDYQAELCI